MGHDTRDLSTTPVTGIALLGTEALGKMQRTRQQTWALLQRLRARCALKLSWLAWLPWVSVLLVTSLLVTGCDLGPDQAADSSSATVSVTPVAQMPHRGPLVIQIDPDITGSYPRALMDAFIQQMAGWIDTLPRVGSDQATIYVTYISHAPYEPSASPLAFTVPAVSNYPTLKQTPVPSCPDNPYSCSDAQATATTQNHAAARTYQEQLQVVEGQLNTVKQATAQQTQKLRSLHPPVDNQATSIWGVLNLAAERFSSTSGEKWLILASDLSNNTSLDQVPPDLTGVHVLAMNLYCTSAVSCQRTKSAWTAVFHHAHVASVRFLEPEQSHTAASPWS